MVWLLNSQGMKNCRCTESFRLSILTIYTNGWSPFWHVHCCHVYFFFCEVPKYVQAKSRLAHLDWKFMDWASMLTKLAGYDEYRLACFHPIRTFLANENYHSRGCQTGCLFTWAARSMQLAPYSATFACSRMLFCVKC